MNVVIWGAIYVVLSVMLGLFLFKEKQIIEFFKEKEKIMAEKIENVTTEKKSKDNIRRYTYFYWYNYSICILFISR